MEGLQGNFIYINIPLYQVQYKKWKKYGYSKTDERENTKEVLIKASDGYCMYCYTRIKVDNKLFGNLEHAIEKKISDKLIECIPNIGIVCPMCNQSFKRIGERKRKVTDLVRKEFEEKSRCSAIKRKQCRIPCKPLRDLQSKYNKMPGGEIILQPMGVVGEQSGENMALQYDIMKMEFQPNTNLHTYSREEISFINKHILRFRLNDPIYKTHQLADYIRNVIDSGGVLQKYEYNNLIVKLFADKLEEKTAEEKVDICSKIYTMIFMRL